MKPDAFIKLLDRFGLDKDTTVKILREIEYDYIHYSLKESIEEEANIHPKLPDKLHCLHSVIEIINKSQ